MKKRWCVREGIFEGDNCLWWLNKEVEDTRTKQTPMTIALKNADSSKVFDVRAGGYATTGRRRGF